MILVPWIILLVIVIGLLALDLGVFNRKAHVISVKEALGWSIVWVAISLLFNVGVYFAYDHRWFGLGESMDGSKAALQFLTGYLVEKSLSVDNIFVIALIFSYFRISALYQHRILFWGILGALIARGVLIGVGVALLNQFEWMTYLFGILLVYTAIKMLMTQHDTVDPEHGFIYRWFSRLYPLTRSDGDGKFLVWINGKRHATILLLALVIIEGTDVMFAIDSIPAIFAITRDPFIVFSSNIFAILGLRSLYFVLSGYLGKLYYLKYGLVVLLGFIGVKMLLIHFYKIPPLVSLGIIAVILGVSVTASLLKRSDSI
jgi:tellurite resistance protein TerC